MGGKNRQPRKKVSVKWSKNHGNWCIAYGSTNLYSPIWRKTDAIADAREVAKQEGAELIVHNKNGRIAFRNSYGRDASHRPG